MAIQLPNNKISRTLPEQVGFNSTKIAEIIKWINDSDFIDKVLNLSDPSGTLTEAQYAIADLSPSYIVYGGKVFIKSLEDSDNIDFLKAGTEMSGSDSMIASVERVRIIKATKAYQYAVVQLFESYNKTQIDTLLAEKASLSGATFTGGINAPSINGETNPSVKPIYCHPISIRDDTTITNKYRITCLIFNNDPTPFTLASFKEFLDITGAATEYKIKIMLSGGYYNGSNMIIASYLYKEDSTHYYLVGMAAAGNSSYAVGGTNFYNIFDNSHSVLEDGVNQIN